MLPFLLLTLLVALDFGRVFLGWVSLNNSARIAANYAAENPDAWNALNPNTGEQAPYDSLVRQDASGINCALPSTLPAPSFPDGTSIGEPAQVSFTCSFQLITPVIGNIVGNPLPVGVSAAFPIRAGAIAGIPVASAAPTATPTPTPTATPSPAPTSTASPTPTPTPMCTVPNLVGISTQQAQDYWGTKGHGTTQGAGFSSNVIFSPQVGNGNNYLIGTQSLAAGTSEPCDASTVITVTP